MLRENGGPSLYFLLGCFSFPQNSVSHLEQGVKNSCSGQNPASKPNSFSPHLSFVANLVVFKNILILRMGIRTEEG